jgi:hypothetical protein
MGVSAGAQRTEPSRPLAGRPLADVLTDLQRRGLPIVFSSEVVRGSMRVVAEPQTATDRQILDEILAAHGLEARAASGGVLVVLPRRAVTAQARPAPDQPSTAIVRGVVIDGRTSAPLRNVLVRTHPSETEVTSDADGRFDLGALNAGTHRLYVSLVGYSLTEADLTVTAGAPLEVTVVLSDGARAHTEEVVVVGDRFRGASTSTSASLALSGTDMRELRGVLADDPFRAVQVAPGVSTGNDFRSEFSIRGSDYRHVGLLVDGLVLGWPVHAVREDWAGGSVGLLNADTIDNLTLVAGVYPQDRPARSGGWVDITMREGSRTRTQAHAAVGMTAASLITEGPIGRGGRGAWIVSARQSYLQWVLKRLGNTGTRFGFGDLFGKVVFDITPRHHVQLLAIAGQSLLELERSSPDPNLTTRGSMTTGIASTTWRATFGPATLTQRFGYSATSFRNSGAVTGLLASGSGGELAYRADAAVAAGRIWTVQGGLYVRRRRVDEAFNLGVGFVGGPRTSRIEAIAGTGTEVVIHTRVSGQVGVTRLEGGVLTSSQRSTAVSPWATIVVPAGAWSVRAGAGIVRQRPNLEQSASTFGGGALAPEFARHLDLEVERGLGGTSRVVVTVYRRDERDGLRLTGDEFRLGGAGVTVPSLAPVWRNTLRTRASGLELLVQRRSPSGLSGWVAYAYAVTGVEDVATGERWDGDFDQRHTLNAHAQLRRSPVTSFSAKLRIGSGPPLAGYLAEGREDPVIGPDRNRLRLPVYARFDLRATRSFNYSSHRLTVFAEIINVLARENRGPACSCTNWIDAPRVLPNGRVIDTTQKMLPFLPSVGLVFDF